MAFSIFFVPGALMVDIDAGLAGLELELDGVPCSVIVQHTAPMAHRGSPIH